MRKELCIDIVQECILFLAAVFVPLGQQEVYASQEQSTKILNNTTHKKEVASAASFFIPFLSYFFEKLRNFY